MVICLNNYVDFGTNKGIYKITCTPTGKFYIGSSVNLKRRRFWHFCQLKHNKHDNQYLQAAYLKYGKDAFIFEIVEFFNEDITIEEVLKIEQIHIDESQACNPSIGYNLCKIAGAPTPRNGFKHSSKTLKLFSEQRKGKQKSESFKQTLSTLYKGKSMKERTENPNWVSSKVGKTMKEITNNPNWIDSKVGKKRPQELIKKLSDTRKGSGNPSYKSDLITLVNKQGEISSKTRYEWRCLNVHTHSLLRGAQIYCNGWALYCP
jgi:group I intron endonuclease